MYIYIFKEHTAGINCETCEDGWYREAGVLPNASVPCKHCDCHLLGSIGVCYKDDSEASQGKVKEILYIFIMYKKFYIMTYFYRSLTISKIVYHFNVGDIKFISTN